jgi:nucleotide-binding universal stress UspA family protein
MPPFCTVNNAVALTATALLTSAFALVAPLAGSGVGQHPPVIVVHVAKVWGTSLGLQHPSLKPSAAEIGTAQDLAARAAQDMHAAGVVAEALVISGRDVGKALAPAAERAGASAIVIGRGRGGRLSRLLRSPDPARAVMGRIRCTLVVN